MQATTSAEFASTQSVHQCSQGRTWQTDRILQDDRFVGQLILLPEFFLGQCISSVYGVPLKPRRLKCHSGAVPGLIQQVRVKALDLEGRFSV